MTRPIFEWSKEDVQIIKACAATDAGRHALALIVQRLAGITSSSFASDPITMAFNEGRRWVAIELNSAVSLPINKLVKEPDEPRTGRILTATERAARSGG